MKTENGRWPSGCGGFWSFVPDPAGRQKTHDDPFAVVPLFVSRSAKRNAIDTTVHADESERVKRVYLPGGCCSVAVSPVGGPPLLSSVVVRWLRGRPVPWISGPAEKRLTGFARTTVDGRAFESSGN